MISTFGMSHSGWSAGSGSGSNTSSAAPAIAPAAQRGDQVVGHDELAAADVHEPRCGFIAANAAASNRCRVCSVSGATATT